MQAAEDDSEDTLLDDLSDTAEGAGDTVKNWAGIIGGAVGGGVGLLILLGCIIYCCFCRR